jgi:hypothetical protein
VPGPIANRPGDQLTLASRRHATVTGRPHKKIDRDGPLSRLCSVSQFDPIGVHNKLEMANNWGRELRKQRKAQPSRQFDRPTVRRGVGGCHKDRGRRGNGSISAHGNAWFDLSA